MFAPNFEEIGHVTLIFRTQKPPQKFGEKAAPFKNGLSTAKIFHMVTCLAILFHSYQRTFGRDEFFSLFMFFSFIFCLNLVRSSPKPQNIEI